MAAARTLEELLAAATARIERLEPLDAFAAAAAGALIVDIRSDDARRLDGIVPGSLHIPRPSSNGASLRTARRATRMSSR